MAPIDTPDEGKQGAEGGAPDKRTAPAPAPAAPTPDAVQVPERSEGEVSSVTPELGKRLGSGDGVQRDVSQDDPTPNGDVVKGGDDDPYKQALAETQRAKEQTVVIGGQEG